MEIRKTYTLPNTHIVRNCSSERCKKSIHCHIYEVEVFFEAPNLDNGVMILDFGLTKRTIKDFLSIFKDAYSYWNVESKDYIKGVHSISEKWIELPISPSAEGLSLMLLKVITDIINNTKFTNGEGKVKVTSVRVHETRTGFSQAYEKDLKSTEFPKFELDEIKVSKCSQKTWNFIKDSIKNKIPFENPVVTQQVDPTKNKIKKIKMK